MNSVNIYLEERFIYFEGGYYSLVYEESYWMRYLQVFSIIFVLARVKKISNLDELPKGYKRVENSSINFIDLPYYHGLYQSILFLPLICFFILKQVLRSQNNILRLPGIISIISGIICIFFKKKFAVELVGDPYDVFSSGVGGKISKILRFIFTYMTKIIVRKAIAVSYVTETTMQKRYPANNKAFTTYYSSITLEKSVFNKKNIRKQINKDKFQILMVGSLEQMYKGFDVAINAIEQLDFKEKIIVHIIGDGIYKKKIQEIIDSKNMINLYVFHGKISREKIFTFMEEVDLFLMPSRTEGLPRALIEAMSKGLPAIGSDVGGIPELLPKEWIFKSEDYLALSQKITQIYYSYSVEEISRINMDKAKEFQSDILQERRKNFYLVLKNS